MFKKITYIINVETSEKNSDFMYPQIANFLENLGNLEYLNT